ncbi:pantoate--beta-alanine ligase [Jatrophihabitans sp.]|uniref:pantoate--beta-alanine ligase n=1 Tax=Jatrophihabitans sp. TaxID=1932789 RepID=UPI0030C783A9|nr:pantoate--beta-alanine ligase [Jatrophihabitans sp.]
MIVAHSRADLAGALGALAGPLGYVPTMGALHAGHAALIDAARAASESVLVSIFVNPMQFGANEDVSTYPRTLEADLELCREHGADAVWVPGLSDVYPAGPAQVSVMPGPLGTQLEGAARPTHFEGVLTVVAKYFSLIRPAVAFFGEKDYQQLTLIRLMAGDLELGVGVAGVPTVREADGLALSSRNVYLSAEQRQQALALSRALRAGQQVAPDGAASVLAAAQAVLDAEPEVAVSYLELRDPDLGPAPEHGPARLLVAARVGSTRLIDNMAVEL